MICSLSVELLADYIVRKPRSGGETGVVEGTRSDGESELSRRRTVARYNLIDVDHARCVQPASRDVGDISEQISSQLVLNVEVVLDGIRRSVVDVDCARARSRAGAEQ